MSSRTTDRRTAFAGAAPARGRLLRLSFLVFAFAALIVPSAKAAQITFVARERATHNPVPNFRFVVNEDNTINSAVENPHSYSPLVAVGDSSNPTVDLPNGRYLVTVLADPHPPKPSDYKMWGTHFTVSGSAMTVTTDLIANPLPDATLLVKVFHDNLPVSTSDDIPVEEGLAGFKVTLEDPLGEVTVDAYGNPLCGGTCLTDADGVATIPNLPPGRYDVEAIPPDGSGWIQTSTIEGTFHNDAWLTEGADGFSTEEGFLQTATWFGFVRPCEFGNTADDCPTNDDPGNGTIKGRIREITGVRGLGAPVLGAALPKPMIALNFVGGDDEQVYTGRGRLDGTFTIPNVPAGRYELAFWDEQLDTIMQFHNVDVGPGQTVDLGDVGAPRWFGRVRGYAYIDDGRAKDGTFIPGAAGNGQRDCYNGGGGINPNNVATCERPIPNQDLDIRNKDATIRYATFADNNGFYEYPEHFEFEHFMIWEVGYGRFAHASTTAYKTDDFGQPLGYPNNPINKTEGLAGLLQSELTWGSLTNWIDAGKRPYGANENGGIVGIVFYATTRNEFDPRFAVAEDYEPGIPGVTVNLYSAALDASGNPEVELDGSLKKDALLNTYVTDSWYDNRPTNCDILPFLGQPGFLDPKCLELPRTQNQVKDGVFDGGYAFEDQCADPSIVPNADDDLDGIPNRLDPDSLSTTCNPLVPGKYIVEMTPLPGYRVIKEEDRNIDQGDQFVPQVPPPPCAGELHLVNAPDNPADGTQTPLCTSRLVQVQNGFNQNADFFLMTENGVPPAGKIRGLLLDDLAVQLNPASPIYADKRGIPDTPIGFLDFQGNEIARTYSDDNGFWEVLLPSTYTANCPIPTGVCPEVYQVIGNYPGTRNHPDPKWNPNYGTLKLFFEVWPGKTTYADVAILPITGFVQNPTSGFEEPPLCDIPATIPDFQSISTAAAAPGTQITISGKNFGFAKGKLKIGEDLNVTSWSDTQIVASLLTGHKPGAYQVEISTAAGKNNRVLGLTFHVLGVGYNPPVLHVGAGQTYATIQDAIDAAPANALVLVHPGEYRENPIIYKNIKLQGFGPGVTTIDGKFFNFGGMTPAQFQAKVSGIAYDGPSSVPMGQVITVIAADGQFSPTFRPQIDGFTITGGTRVRGNRLADSQGGGIYLHAYARNMIISNNLIQANAGNLGGGIILGRPYVENPDAAGALDNKNEFVWIHHNRVMNNGGVSLAGGIGIFNGAQGYNIDSNVICGNYSAEYGGGVSHYGMSKGGKIQNNEILFNYSFDEGGGVMIAGEQNVAGGAGVLPPPLSKGSGQVTIDRNRIQFNFSNDDGGGIRTLQPVDGPITILNNMIANNIAADTGGGIALDDTLNATIANNTIAKNVSTATSEDADRSTCNPPPLGSCPHGAGLTSEGFSAALIAARAPANDFSDPVLFNNIFWQNEAFSLSGNPANPLPSAGIKDLEVVATVGPRCLTPRYSLLTTAYACSPSATNKSGTPPQFLEAVNTNFVALAFANDPAFVTVLVKQRPTDPQGNYHVDQSSPALESGTASYSGVAAPNKDFDGEARPIGTAFDIGADERAFVAPPPPPNFTLAATPASATANQGGFVTYTVTLTAQNGFTGTVSLSALGLPTGATATFTPASIVTSGTSQLQVQTAATTPPGTSTLTLQGTSGALVASTAVNLVVNPVVPATTKFPGSTTILTGTFRSGSTGNLAADDALYFRVNASLGAVRWYGSFGSVPNALSSLRVTYKGQNSISCSQQIAIWNWTSSFWQQLDLRTVGVTDVLIANLLPPGTLANYVSNLSGLGTVRVRVRCLGSGAFFSSGNLMKIVYS